MGDPLGDTGIKRRNLDKQLAQVLLEIDNYPENVVRDLLKVQASLMYEGAGAEKYQIISVDDAVQQCGGDVHEALKRYMTPWFSLAIYTERGNLGTQPPDAPPIVQKVWKNYARVILHGPDDEVRIASEVQKRTRALESFLHELSKTKPEIGVLERLFNTYIADAQQQRDEEIGKRGLAEDAIEGARHEMKEKDARIHELEIDTKSAEEEIKRYERENATQAQMYADAVNTGSNFTEGFALQKARADDLEKKLARASTKKRGVIGGVAAASFLAAALLFYRAPQPVVQSEPVPEKVTNYVPSNGHIMVTFGKDRYEVSADVLSDIYKEIWRDEQKANRKFSPAEEKKYYDGKADRTRIIK